MQTSDFLSAVLPDRGAYCAFGAKKVDGETRRKQKFFTQREQLADACLSLDENGFDSYFALASFRDARAEKPRSARNVEAMRSLYIDLDCGEEKGYPDKRAALLAFKTFCANLKLPRPILVDSGGGVHAYWALDADAHYGDWLPVATLLKQACAEQGLQVDPVVTADAARVLRLPGTTNRKFGLTRPVSILSPSLPAPVSLEQMAALLRAVVKEKPIFAAVQLDVAVKNELKSKLLNNKASAFETVLRKSMSGSGCAQIAHLYENQDTASEPEWRALLSVIKFCKDADEFVHRASEHHPDYDPAATEEKLRGIAGPYTCARFSELAPERCEGCPLAGKIKSPIALGRFVQEGGEEEVPVEPEGDDEEAEADDEAYGPAISRPKTITIPKYPEPYFRGLYGGVYRREKDDEGENVDICVYHNDLYVVRRLRDPEFGEAVVMRLHLPKDGIREFTAPLSAITSKEEFRKHMSMHGVAVWGNSAESLMRYITTWVIKLQSEEIAREARTQFGWSDKHRTSFVVGGMEITATGAEINPPSSHTASLFPAFEPQGSFEEWKKLMDFYNRPGFDIHQHVVGTAFGSILMDFMPVHGALLHLHSLESGLGKTTAMLAAASVWGNPKSLVLSQNDTHNTKMLRGEAYKNLPLYIDELTNPTGKDLSDLVYQITDGRQRGRMKSGSNEERYRGAPWRLIAVSTANAGLVERIRQAKAMPKAEAQRVLEHKVTAIQLEKADTDAFSDALSQHYGHAGPVFAQYVLRNAEAVKELLKKVQARIDAKASLTAANRFWSAEAACTLTGLLIAKQLGLVQYDTAQHFKWITSELLSFNKTLSEEMDEPSEDILGAYLREHWDYILRIKSTADRRVAPANSGLEQHLVAAESMPRGKFLARYEPDTRMLYLVPHPFRVWCAERQIPFKALTEDLTKRMGAKRMQIRLSKGLSITLPPTQVLAVKLPEAAIEVLDAGDSS
jgi:hypothetical protein